MQAVFEETVSDKGLNLHLIRSEKFKTINIVAKFRAPLQRETITMRALLPYILQQGTQKYPTEKELQVKLDNLYGAVLSIDGTKKGNSHMISFRLEVANQKYIADESSIIGKAIDLLKEIIYYPKTENNGFYPKTFAREKETLQQKMNAIIDDKMAYANMRLIDEMCQHEAYAIHVHGYEEDLPNLTPENVYTYYEQLLSEDQLDIYILGDFEQDQLRNQLTSSFKKEETKAMSFEEEKNTRTVEIKTVVEKQSVKQAKLHMGYRTNATYKDNDYFALHVFNGIFGGFPSSKLFLNVREKNSLAYYAASRMESHKGLLLVFSGIDPADYEQAKDIIMLQMEAMKSGDFTEEELEETKSLIVNQLLETLDHPQGIVEMLYQQVLGDKKVSPDDFIASIKQVTKEEVIQVANKIELDTVYLLTNESGEKIE
ncbi:EF-P 5-aminopentanol modification-associated protein YfmF [Virgibacillus sp. W0181]|uniref:EF-P 5-aminopentanol modification-associated protein YfmF n=1 Tax=Virgibacillus sp. W0181 TaxID=3391581 RepID=UPI003F48A7A7